MVADTSGELGGIRVNGWSSVCGRRADGGSGVCDGATGAMQEGLLCGLLGRSDAAGGECEWW